MLEKPLINTAKSIRQSRARQLGAIALAISAGVIALLFWLLPDLPERIYLKERAQITSTSAPQKSAQRIEDPPDLLVNIDIRDQLSLKMLTETPGSSIGAALIKMVTKQIHEQKDSKASIDSTPLYPLIQRFLNPDTPLKIRRGDAWQLAKAGTPDAMAALKQALDNAPSYLKAAIGEALGHCKYPDAKKMILSLLDENDEVACRGAIRGLAASQDPEAVALISQFLLDPRWPDSLRVQAALALGEVDTLAAYKALTNSFSRIEEMDADGIAGAILEGLGKLPFTKTEPFFSSLLESPNTPSKLRVAAIEALADTSKEAVPFLLKYAVSDSDKEVRAAVAWAISALEQTDDISSKLLGLLETEKEPLVRRRIFEAISNQETLPVDKLWPIAMAEQNSSSRLAALELLANACNKSNRPELAAQFDHIVVPELLAIALQEGNIQPRLRSIMALKRAMTPNAVGALETISKSSDSKLAESALSAVKYIRQIQQRTSRR